MTSDNPDDPGRQPGRKNGAPLPYGAIEGQPEVGASTWDRSTPSSARSGPWYVGGSSVHTPSRFRAGVLGVAAVIVAALIVAVGGVLAQIRVMYGVALVIVLILLAETLYAQVRVDPYGITRRSLRGTTTYLREELAEPVLHRYVRRGRGGPRKVCRLSIRRRGGHYGFMITSDLFRYEDVETIATRVGAARPKTARGVDIEAEYPGATRWAHRHPVLVVLIWIGIVWLVTGAYLMWALG